MPKATKKEINLTVPMISLGGKDALQMDLPEDIFGGKINKKLLAQAMRIYRERQRQGTVGYKTRGVVSGTTRKMYKQKGTGNARHGSSKAPIFVGGGVAHGPKPSGEMPILPRQMRKDALLSALADLRHQKRILVAANLAGIEAKTRTLVDVMKQGKIDCSKDGVSTLLVTTGKQESLLRAGRNIPNLTIIPVEQLNAYAVLMHRHVIVMKEALSTLSKSDTKDNNQKKVSSKPEKQQVAKKKIEKKIEKKVSSTKRTK